MVLGHKQEQNQRFEHENAQKQREEGAPADGSTSLARKLRLKVLVFERGLDEPGSAMPRSARLLPGSGFVQRGAGNAPPGPAVISAAPGYPRLRSPLTRHASGPVNEPCEPSDVQIISGRGMFLRPGGAAKPASCALR